MLGIDTLINDKLAVDKVDLYYMHRYASCNSVIRLRLIIHPRPDPTVPIEVTVGAMAELVA
jgi:aryl-alcohol dehydrogenase-like predicted oxidoreductase